MVRLKDLYKALDTVSGVKLKEKLVANEEQAKMSKTLATIETAAPITDFYMMILSYSGPNMEEVIEVWKELSFKTLLEKSDYIAEESETTEITFKIVRRNRLYYIR